MAGGRGHHRPARRDVQRRAQGVARGVNSRISDDKLRVDICTITYSRRRRN